MDLNHPPRKKPARPVRGLGGTSRRAAPWIPVLHIDDDSNDTELLLAATTEAGVPFRVHNIPDAEQAIAFLSGTGKYADRRRFQLPALILLDLKMPRSTGIEILKWVRAYPGLQSIPVVVLSGSQSEENIRQAYASGANAYLVKPLGFSALVDLLRSLNLALFVAPRGVSQRIDTGSPLA